MTSPIAVLDIGIGNARAVQNMFIRLGISADLVNSAESIMAARQIVFPGVGSFDRAVNAVHRIPGLKSALDECVLQRGTPFLGICLGMQLVFERSEEGILDGFGWLKGISNRIQESHGFPVPHIGWSRVNRTREGRIFSSSPVERFYFAHSFAVCPEDKSVIVATVNYGTELVAAIEHQNIFGVQYHPEKSHKFGMKTLRHFAMMA